MGWPLSHGAIALLASFIILCCIIAAKQNNMSGYFGLIAANIVKQILAHVTMDTGQHKSGVDGWDYTDRDNCS